MSEQVNHPSHYCVSGRKECIYEMLELYGPQPTAAFALLSAYKYLYRAGNKEGNPDFQDIDKAKWYFNFVKTLSQERYECLTGIVKLYIDIEESLKDLGVL